jgi:hypothetical protein
MPDSITQPIRPSSRLPVIRNHQSIANACCLQSRGRGQTAISRLPVTTGGRTFAHHWHTVVASHNQLGLISRLLYQNSAELSRYACCFHRGAASNAATGTKTGTVSLSWHTISTMNVPPMVLQLIEELMVSLALEYYFDKLPRQVRFRGIATSSTIRCCPRLRYSG